MDQRHTGSILRRCITSCEGLKPRSHMSAGLTLCTRNLMSRERRSEFCSLWLLRTSRCQNYLRRSRRPPHRLRRASPRAAHCDKLLRYDSKSGMPLRQLGLEDLYPDDWLLSAKANAVFIACTWTILIGTMLLTAGVGDSVPWDSWRALANTAMALFPFAGFYLWGGMLAHWSQLYRATPARKRFWFACLVAGLCWGSCIYFLFVYRQTISRPAQ